MRLIGQIKNETDAKVFGDYLTATQIKNLVEPETDGTFSIWIHDEEKLAAGQEALAGFKANPHDAKYRGAGKTAAAIKEQEQREQEEFNKRVVTAQNIWPRYAMGWCTIGLIAISVAVAVLGGGTPPSEEMLRQLFISQWMHGLPEVRHGEVWRLITPIFVHMSIPHILFNMLSLKFLGSIVESRLGSWKLLAMSLVIAAASNYGYYYFFGPLFGGMSGVLYGLFGFIWIRGKCDPNSGLRIDQANTVMMIAWFFLCVFKFIPHVANTIHAIGLGMGMAMGAWPLVGKRLR